MGYMNGVVGVVHSLYMKCIMCWAGCVSDICLGHWLYVVVACSGKCGDYVFKAHIVLLG